LKRLGGRLSKGSQTHEDFSREEKIEGSSDRNFGLTFAAFFALVTALKLWKNEPHWQWWLAVAALMLAIALIRPGILGPFNKVWLKLGLLLFSIVSPITLGLLFYTTVTPIGLLVRARNRDLLQRRFDPKASTYWIARQPPGPAPETMTRQF
jgi:hypothetical protein